jgi:PhzF family phenazine biosynthesis protein
MASASKSRPFNQVDVFTTKPLVGNPLAVVLDGTGLSTDTMRIFARWTNLSETTFLLPPTDPSKADYKVRIFTPTAELPFAGHPTLGSCHVWLNSGGKPRNSELVIQECGSGLVKIKRKGDLLAFAEPPLIHSGEVDPELVLRLSKQLNIKRESIVDAQWGDNGPGWILLLLKTAEAVLSVKPGLLEAEVGLVGPYPEGHEAAFEVRALYPQDGVTLEDPVTGSLNASLAGWLIRSGRAPESYGARQGTVIGREGKIHVERDAEGVIWIGGAVQTVVSGNVLL